MTLGHGNGRAAESRARSELTPPKPYLIVGAGPLTATRTTKANQLETGNIHFSIVHTAHRSGDVSQISTPRNLRALAKLVRLLAEVLADDGCLPAEERADLCRLAVELRVVEANRFRHCRRNDAGHGK